MATSIFEGHVAVFAYDIVGFTGFDQAGQVRAKARTDRVLAEARHSVGLTAGDWFYQDAGDGGYLLIRTDARKALAVLEAFVGGMEAENRELEKAYRVRNRYALHYDTLIVEEEGSGLRFIGDAINNCARLLSGMRKDYVEQAVCSGAYRAHVLTFGTVDGRLFDRLADIVGKHGKRQEVWNLIKSPGYGISVAKEDLYAPPSVGPMVARAESFEQPHGQSSLSHPLIGAPRRTDRIFLAHALEDKDKTRKLYDELKARNFDPWLDEKDLVAGKIWQIEISNAIRNARVFLACLSRQSVRKIGYVQNEFRQALSSYGERPPGSIYLIPVRFDDCEVPDLQIPDRGLSLRDIHWVDLWLEDGLDRLVLALQEAIGTNAVDEVTQVEAIKHPTTFSPRSFEPFSVFRDVERGPELVVIPAGSFLMGSPANEEGRYDDESPQHEVRIARRFALGRYPVMFEEYDRFTGATGHKRANDEGWGRGRRPVINVSWEDAKAYIAWLSTETGKTYRLPSEAEWEYACRSGTTTCYSWGEEISPENANYVESGLKRTTEVGSYSANPWRLHDMHGNVFEWCEDVWHETYEGAPNDNAAWTEGGDQGRRLLRGGSWRHDAVNLRSAFRDGAEADGQGRSGGFRVARKLP